MFEGFETSSQSIGETRFFVRRAGSGPALLLLHGFPETHLMWRDIAPVLAAQFTVICIDLPGYGESGCPPQSADHSSLSKRAIAADLVLLMQKLGLDHFMVAGHDRGGRVAYRMALDHPQRVDGLAVLDIIPTHEAWERADARLALAFWPWALLAQPEPLPERLIAAAPEAVIDDALAQWGSSPEIFPHEVRQPYVATLRDPPRVHAICEEYRAAATIDREHDAEDRRLGRKIRCPVLALWSRDSALDSWYADAGGPLAIWRDWAVSVQGRAVPGGHFFPEVHPTETAAALADFFVSRPG